jgi:muramoyltetrapeptide carboxypeptidase
MMIQPPFINPADKVAIITTARKVNATDLKPAIDILENWGLEVVLGEHIYKEYHQFGGTDAERATDLQRALDNTEIKAVFCARGGYGTTRILDKINFENVKKSPKWVVGFSDITALHCHLQKNGIQSIHATMPLLFNQEGGEIALESLKNALFGKKNNYVAINNPLNRLGKASGEVIGGNLSILNHIIDTESDIDYTGKILFLEDLDEYLYHIDRMMLHLKRCGKLKNLAGLAIGHFSKMNDNTIPFGKTAYEIIKEHVAEYNYPVGFGFPVGHEPDNRAFICGSIAEMNIADQATIQF